PYNLNRLFLTGTIPVIPSILTDSMKPHYIYSVKGCIYFDRSPKSLKSLKFIRITSSKAMNLEPEDLLAAY
ncbi:hypothetical protein, partial [Dehalobacter sp. TeCB1]|uniref:hypothetical protein n=1 Tax=Dehalobacter sp. TeCB1 TaxID=1843715 RepID=UPI001A9A54FB